MEMFGDLGGFMGFITYFFLPWVPQFAGIRADAIMANRGYTDPYNKSKHMGIVTEHKKGCLGRRVRTHDGLKLKNEKGEIQIPICLDW